MKYEVGTLLQIDPKDTVIVGLWPLEAKATLVVEGYAGNMLKYHFFDKAEGLKYSSCSDSSLFYKALRPITLKTTKLSRKKFNKLLEDLG